MHLQVQVLVAVAVPLVSAQLSDLAKAAGKLYFGTSTDNGELNFTQRTQILSNTSEFGQLTSKECRQKFHSLGIDFLSNYNDPNANACSMKLSSLM